MSELAPALDASSYLLAASAAFVISFVSATGGLTGAFLLLPFQVSVLGFASPAASATNHLYNVIAAPGGSASYWRQQRMFWPVAAVMMVGTIPGILAGVALRVRYLPDPGRFRLFAGAVLIVIGLLILARGLASAKAGPTPPSASIVNQRIDWRRIRFTFDDQEHSLGVPQLFLFCLATGAVGGAYGVGGGIFTTAYLVGLCGIPIHVCAGATLISTWVASCAGALGFALAHGPGTPASPLWLLGLAMGFGGLAGGYLGARAQHRLPSVLICTVIALLMLALGLSYLFWRA